MKSSIDTNLGSAAHVAHAPPEGERRAPRARERDELDSELWALAVTDLLVQRLPPPRPSAEAASVAPVRNGADRAARDAGGTGEVAPDGAPAPAQPAAGHGGAAAGASRGRSDGIELPSQLSAEVSDERFGRLQLHVARGQSGLDIVINVADSHVKALIEAEQAILLKTLKDAGLRVASVQIGNSSQPGTGFAQDRGGAERPRAGATLQRPNARRRAYPSSRDEEEDQSSEGVDFTA